MILKKLVTFSPINLLFYLFASYTATAQIIPDNTLGNESSVVVPNQNIREIDSDRIDGGAVRGSNLFHSFQEFNVDAGRGVYFSNPNGIANILTRVTGDNISNILGRLGVLGNANLFLINPNGIIFGENASLDIGGSFFATSADRVIFANGSEFSATNPDTPPLLTINIPIGLWFRENPSPVVNRSVASIVDVDETGEEFEIPIGLEVPPEKTLALVGGEVRLEGGILTTLGGRIELGSVAGNSFIALQPVAEGFALDYSGVRNFQDISLSELALVDASGEEGGGDIQLHGRQVSLTGDSEIISTTFGSEPGGDVFVIASESVEMIGGNTTILTSTEGTGTGGDVTIETRRLTLLEGAFVETTTFAEGKAGNLTVRASESLQLLGIGEIEEVIFDETTGSKEVVIVNASPALFALVESEATGQGGTITIETGQLLIRDGAQISVETFGLGQGGNLIVKAFESVELIGGTPDRPSALLAGVFETATADGGTITVETGRLIVRDGAQISTDTFSSGRAGDLTVKASESVELIGTTPDGQFASGLFALVDPEVTGDGGTLTVETPRLTVLGGAQIATSTAGSEGRGGDLTINAESILLSGASPLGDVRSSSGIFVTAEPFLEDESGNQITTGADVGNLTINTTELIVEDAAKVSAENFGTGLGGNATLNLDRLIVRSGGLVSAGSLVEDGVESVERGPGGTLTINATESVEVTGTGTLGSDTVRSRLVVESQGTGDAGNLNLVTPRLTLQGGGQITGAKSGSEGQGGTVTIDADSILVSGTAPVEEVGVRDSSGIFVSAEPVPRDQAGEPRLDDAGNPFITGGNAGSLTINATELIVEDGATVSAENFGTGLGGNATLNLDRLIVRSGGLVSAASLIEAGVESVERGPGGTLTINATESVEVTGTGTLGSETLRSRLVAESQGTGDAGSLNIFTPNLRVNDQAEVTVSATGSGEAGSLTVDAENIRLSNASLSSETRLGTEGNITINTSDLRLRRGSAITTNSLETGTGGNITINGDQLVAIENSDISANAQAGPGGQVIINVDAIFATEFRERQTNASDITATSELGAEFSGTVELNTEFDTSSGLVDLPQTIVDPAALIAQDPCKQGQNSEFFIIGRGGIAPNLTEDLPTIQGLAEFELIEPVTPQVNRSSPRRQRQTQNRENNRENTPLDSRTIVPARGWIRTEDGEVILVGYDPTKTGVQRQPQSTYNQCQSQSN